MVHLNILIARLTACDVENDLFILAYFDNLFKSIQTSCLQYVGSLMQPFERLSITALRSFSYRFFFDF